MYDRFSRPFHDLVFQRYGGGGLHNCGPNPCLAGYLSHQPAPRSLDLNYDYSKQRSAGHQTRVSQESVRLPGRPAGRTGRRRSGVFREIMELMAPDVIVIPHVIVPARQATRANSTAACARSPSSMPSGWTGAGRTRLKDGSS